MRCCSGLVFHPYSWDLFMIDPFQTPLAELSTPQKMDNPKISTETTDPVPRFLLIRKKEGDFAEVSPFLISKTVYGLVGETKTIRKIRDGLLVETVSNAQSRRLLKVQLFAGCPVEVIAHGSLNTCKGVIYCRDLLNCTIEEVLDGLKQEGVVNVQRIKNKINGTFKDTPSHILTFNTPRLPTHVRVAFYRLAVRPYIPPPLRCYKCQLLGHTASRCKSELQVCICGKPLHEGTPCQIPIKCVNCEGDHSARSKICPKYKLEAAIQKVKTVEKVTYAEARRKVIAQTPSGNISYAQAAQSRNMNIQGILSELAPALTDLIKNILESKFESTYRQRTDSLSSSITSRVRSAIPPPSPASPEKRKRPPQIEDQEIHQDQIETTEDDLQSETSEAGVSTQPDEATGPRKKKRGWPKGKPRTAGTCSQPSSHT